MKSFTVAKTLFTTLSLNNSTTNNALGGILINDNHRYYIQKYFDNERSFTMLTVGGTTGTLTGSLLSGATTGTLSATWTYPGCQQLVVFSNSEQRTVFFTQGSAAITWQSPLSSAATTSITMKGVQSYRLPANVSKIKNPSITIGQLVYTPSPVQTTQEWMKLNALPYNSSMPAYFFVYNGEVSFWPIPSDYNNIITLTCQIFVPDMTYEDYTTGTLATAVGSNIVTGTGTSWSSQFPIGVDLTFANLFLIMAPPNGDGYAYQIQSFVSDTSLILTKPVLYVPKNSSITYTIGQYPLLQSDFHDVPVIRALRTYFNSIVKDTEKFTMYDKDLKEKELMMAAYLGTKQVNVDLSDSPVSQNPNLFYQASS